MISNLEVYDTYRSALAAGYPMVAAVMDNDDAPGQTMNRADRLASKADGHDNFLTGVLVSFDLTCSIKMWTQIQRYHFLQIVSSQSTMHRLAEMDLTQHCSKYVAAEVINAVAELQEGYLKEPTQESFLAMIYSCPVGLELTARVTTNYRQLKTIYKQRRNHTLPEWRQFCEWIETLPNSHWITGDLKND